MTAQCPRCGASLPPDAPSELCPRCLMAMNFATETAVTGSGETTPGTPLSPEELAPYFPQLEILECLGRGGMGVVYKARQKSLNRLVALKILAPERVAVPEFAHRFAREAEALARLSQPNIVTVYDFGESGGLFYLLMEFVDGVNLRQAMAAGRLAPRQALAIVPPICEALQYAHDQGIVHRDIKPENLLLDRSGRIKIADFGIAKMLGAEGVAENQPAGTPRYMAPEQKRDPQAVDHRADIYSLGVVLYEMLTGELPSRGMMLPSQRVEVDVRLDEIVLRALKQRPELRYTTVLEMKTDLEAAAQPAPPPQAVRRPRRSTRRVLLTVAAVLAILVGLPLAWWLAQSPLYLAKATLEVKPDSVYWTPQRPNVELDPQFVATQFQVLHKGIILDEVVQALSLRRLYAEGNAELSPTEARERLASRISLSAIRNTGLFELGVYDRDPQKAAEIANMLAIVYRNRRFYDLSQMIERGLSQFQAEVDKQRAIVEAAAISATAIRVKDGIADPNPEDTQIPLQAGTNVNLTAYTEAKVRYINGRRNLEAAEMRLSEARMSVKMDFEAVKIWEKATPPVFPSRRWF